VVKRANGSGNYSDRLDADLVPMAVDAEMATLGSILIDESVLIPVTRVVKPKHFHRPAHTAIFEAMVKLKAAGTAIDLMTVATETKNSQVVKEAGGVVYLTKLTECVAVATHARHYAETVYRAAARREMMDAGAELVRTAYDETENFDDLVPRARAILARVDDHAEHAETGDVYDALIDLVADRGDALSTGTLALDRMLGGGLRPGKLMVLTGRSGAGKTWIWTGMEVAAIDAGARVCDFTLEMSRAERIARLGACKFGGAALRLLDPPKHWTKADHELYADISAWLSGKPIKIFERQQEIHNITTLARMYGADLVGIDYYQNLQKPADMKRASGDDIDASLAGEIERLAKPPGEMGPCVIVVSQLNQREGMKYGAHLNAKCDAHISMVEGEPIGNKPTVTLVPEKNRWAPDAKSGVEFTFVMDKTRGQLIPVDPGMSEPRTVTAYEPDYEKGGNW
jgi:replicative DNA helicase